MMSVHLLQDAIAKVVHRYDSPQSLYSRLKSGHITSSHSMPSAPRIGGIRPRTPLGGSRRFPRPLSRLGKESPLIPEPLAPRFSRLLGDYKWGSLPPPMWGNAPELGILTPIFFYRTTRVGLTDLQTAVVCCDTARLAV